jgi:hypothetical protein
MDLDNKDSSEKEANYVTECTKLFENILSICKDEKYMQSRLVIHMRDILPNVLTNEYKNHVENEKRKVILENELQSFQTYFLATHLYYFAPSNSTFYLYDGSDYKQVKEDDIIYKVLSTVTYDNKDLIDWKHKTKVSLIKKIKGRNLLKTLIPETKTIQRILNNLSPAYFRTKNEAKYFLTCIGDNILKKTSDLNYYVPMSMRQVITALDEMCSVVLGINNITTNFVSRYNENVSLVKCRLIKIRDNSSLIDSWINMLRTDGLNLLCVSAHYSNTHVSSDKFLEKRDELCSYSLYLKNNTRQQLVDKFCSEYIETVNDNIDGNGLSTPTYSTKTTMTWKNIQYVWRRYLSSCTIPNVIYGNGLKTLLKDKYKYEESTDSFINITSRHLPIVSDFMHFWNTTMKPSSCGNDYEVDEICTLFQKFVKSNDNDCVTIGRIMDDDILNILRYYFVDIEIVSNKYILNIDCSLWNKGSDIINNLQHAREHFQIEKKDCDDKTLTFDDLYKYYLRTKVGEFTMSKAYFDKFIDQHLKKFVVYNRVVSDKWLENEIAQEILESL